MQHERKNGSEVWHSLCSPPQLQLATIATVRFSMPKVCSTVPSSQKLTVSGLKGLLDVAVDIDEDPFGC